MIVSFIYCNTKIVKDFDISKLIVINFKICIKDAITAIFLYYSMQSDG
nr:MAG TPA: hypothetical protein [Caudoviricetes sp.]